MKLKKTLASKRKSAAVKPGWVHTPLGKGELDLETFVDSLLNEEFTGWAIVMPSPDHKPLTAQICQAYEYSGHTLDLVL
jgi:sugar phosphate isomerase/epimerase